ncbi:MAG: glycosyltransferase family 2 protein [Granulosicoccus sp.]
MSFQKKLRKKMMSYSKKKLGADRAYRYRENIFKAQEGIYKQTRKLKKFPEVRPDIVLQVHDTQLAITCRFIDPQKKSKRIGLRYNDNSIQWIDENIDHFRSSETSASLSKFSIAPDTPDQFAGLIDCTKPCKQINALAVELVNDMHKFFPLTVQSVAGDPFPVIKRLLTLIPVSETRKRELFDHTFGHMIGSLWSTRTRVDSHADLVAYNEHYEPTAPVVSLIIPIYGRYDFISHQLSQFASDPTMRSHEIIYVIDDPRIASEVRESCRYLAPVFHVAFKVLYLEKNLGYAGANNAGVAIAKADKILLLNSDVFPCKAGWLDNMVSRAGDAIQNTLLGARLLYEDESIQHDGMSFNKAMWLDNLWINEHYGKGLPANLFSCSDGMESRECVTGACILMAKAVYDSLGGFDENYILGDFEDSDLCLKARDAGHQVAIAEDITLYHLERQSQSMVTPDRWKTELTYYNCWLHTNKWNDRIVSLKEETANAG